MGEDMMSSSDVVMLKGSKASVPHKANNWKGKLERALFHPNLLILGVGFLLGRAYILGGIIPFALPFVAVVFNVKRERTALALSAILLGGLTASLQSAIYIVASILFFLLSHVILVKVVAKLQGLLPIQIFISILFGHLLVTYIYNHGLTTYDAMMGLIEASLSYVITIIFLQSIPLLLPTNKRRVLETEEIVCLIILVASIITGTNDLVVYSISIQPFMAYYLLLILSYVAGPTIGATVGVVTGIIISLANVASISQISILAFSGLLGGLLREGKKLGVSFGLLVGTSLVSLYGDAGGNIKETLLAAGAAIILFFLTPKKLMEQIAKMIPGTSEHTVAQQQYLRKIRDITAERIHRFSGVFEAIAASFDHLGREEGRSEDYQIDLFLSKVTEQTCQTCAKKDQCWVANVEKTYGLLEQIVAETARGTMRKNDELNRDVSNHCHKSTKLLDLIEREYIYFQADQRLKKQVLESRKLVAEQLTGVAKVMEDFSRELQKEKESHELQEEQILTALRDFGIEVNNADIYSLEPGNIDIEINIPFCDGRGESEKIIAPLLSDILNENIVVKNEEHGDSIVDFCLASFGSAQKYTIDTGVTTVAKGGGFLSGDSNTTMELGVGKYAIAISDGMGNGERAHVESTETLKLLKKILHSGIEETIAIKSINSILSLRTTDEIYATLDLAMIDLQNATARFLKIGSTPSFIKRGDQVLKIEGNNLPIGIIQNFDVDVIQEQLKPGDLLIMMTDGVYEGAKYVENYEMWMKRKIRELKTDDPQEVADILLEEVIRTQESVDDDMTLVVGKVRDNIPKWGTIPFYGKGKAAVQ